MVNRLAVIAAMRETGCWYVEFELPFGFKEMKASSHASSTFIAD